MVYDTKNNVSILFGGAVDNRNNYLDDTWIFNSTSNLWKKLNPYNNPSPRYHPGMVFDIEEEKVILFGGTSTSGFLSDTWIFDFQDNQWTQIFPENQPQSGADSSLIYDRINNRTIMFGAFINSGVYLDETWAFYYRNTTWIKLDTENKPSARYGAGFIYDTFNNKGILFGGRGTTHKNDTWLFDPITDSWTEIVLEDAPESRYWHEMVYDQVNYKIVLFGGNNPNTIGKSRNDTWIYNCNENQWLEINSINVPSARVSHAMVYDTLNRKVILFGGVSTSNLNSPYNDTWVFNCSNNLWIQLNGIIEDNMSDNKNSIFGFSSTIFLVTIFIMVSKKKLR